MVKILGNGFRFIALIFACAPPLGAAVQDLSQIDQNPETVTLDIEDLRAELQKILDEDRIPGASVALVDRERTIWAGGVGEADVAAGVDVTANHLFRIASISKSFTALAVLRAVEEGLLDLETPVHDLAPDVFTNRWQQTHPVTVAMLLEHTAGFDDLHFREKWVDGPEMTLAKALAYRPHSRVSRWPPGTHTSYSSSGPAVAAYVVETITGQAFEDYLYEAVFGPLGMESSTLGFPADAALMAKGYEADGVSEVSYRHYMLRPSGSMNTSSREMARYLRMMINRGALDGLQILTPETIDRMETPATTLAARAGFTYGRGLGNSTTIIGGHLFHGHNGGFPGFVSRSWYSSHLGIGFFVSLNKRSHRIDDIEKLLVERLARGFEKPESAVAAVSDDELRAITGWYQDVTPRHQFWHAVRRFVDIRRVSLDGSKLFIAEFGAARNELVPVTAKSFRYEDEPVATVFQVVDDGGNPILQVKRESNYRRVGAAWLFFQWAVAAATLSILISAMLFAVVWVPGKILHRMKTIPLPVVLLPFLATLSIVAWLVLPPLISLIGANQDMGTISGASLTFFIGSLVFVALTALSLHTSFGSHSARAGRRVRLHGRLVSLACAVALFHFLSHGWIGLRGWAY